MVGLLPFRLQTAWLYSGIFSISDEKIIPPCLGSQSLVCESTVHLGKVALFHTIMKKILLLRYPIYPEKEIINRTLTPNQVEKQAKLKIYNTFVVPAL